MKIKGVSATLMALLVIVLLVGTVSGELIIETEVTIVGSEVVIDRELVVQTDKDYQGIKFCDNFWTPALGVHGPSSVSLGESISLIVSDDSILEVSGGFEGDNVRADACLRNYGVGTRQSNMYSGKSMTDFQWSASNVTSEMIFTGSFDGRQRSTILVENVSIPHYAIYDEDISTKGKVEIDLLSIIAKPVSVGYGDWLGCP